MSRSWDTNLAAAAAAAAGAALEASGRLVEDFPVPGGVVAITDVNQLLVVSSFGHDDPVARTPMVTDRLFEIGSISKILVSLVVNDLIDGGHLALETVVGDVVPWLADVPQIRSTSVRALLTHTSGLSLGSDALPDDAAEIAAGLSFAVEATERFRYSNVGYMVLGEVVRAITGQRVATVIGANWLDRLAMNNSTSEITHRDRTRFVPGYRPANPGRPWVPGDPLESAPWFETDSASGNVASTPADLAALARALLRAEAARRGAQASTPISVASWTRMTETLAPTGEATYDAGADPVTSSRYGLGINVELIDGHRCVSHGGGMVGYSTFVLADLDLGLGVAVLTNANGNSLGAHVLARLALAGARAGDSGWRPQLDARARALPADALGHFLGPSGEALEVAMRDGVGVVRYGDDEGPLYATPYGRLTCAHPQLRDYHLDRIQVTGVDGWAHGPHVFTRRGTPRVDVERVADPLVGHYRSYSPWFPEFRIIRRLGERYLVAGDGVEAPFEELVLVEESGGSGLAWRLGAPGAPERLVVQFQRDGEVIRLVRDGCAYSRTFSP